MQAQIFKATAGKDRRLELELTADEAEQLHQVLHMAGIEGAAPCVLLFDECGLGITFLPGAAQLREEDEREGREAALSTAIQQGVAVVRENIAKVAEVLRPPGALLDPARYSLDNPRCLEDILDDEQAELDAKRAELRTIRAKQKQAAEAKQNQANLANTTAPAEASP